MSHVRPPTLESVPNFNHDLLSNCCERSHSSPPGVRAQAGSGPPETEVLCRSPDRDRVFIEFL